MKTAGRLRDIARRAEAQGYEALWVVDHLLTAPGLYGTAWLSPPMSPAARRASSWRPASLILALRHPVFMAKEIASLQFLSGGRFELGVGAGWDAHQFEVAGVKLAARGRRTDEILAKLWTGQRVSHNGRYYAFDEIAIDPPLPARPKLWVAGGRRPRTSLSPDPETIAPTVLERICRKADGWLSRASGSNKTNHAPARRDRPGAGQPRLRPPQLHPCRVDRRRGGCFPRTAAGL
jgi:hypothetical protein